MQKLTEKTAQIMTERFGKDTVLPLATSENNVPFVRSVNAYYEDGALYVITYALSNKMRQLRSNPVCAIAGEWFAAHGRGESLGWFGRPENAAIARRLREVFADWIDNGHNNFADENCVILKIALTDGVLFSHGTRYEIDFTK